MLEEALQLFVSLDLIWVQSAWRNYYEDPAIKTGLTLHANES